MSRLTLFFTLVAFVFPSFAPPARSMSMEFMREKIEKRIEDALPGFDISIERVGASYNKGVVIKNLRLSTGGREVLRADTVSVGYGSLGAFVSSEFFENFSPSTEIEIERLELFLSGNKGKPPFPFQNSKPEESRKSADGGENAGWKRRLPKIKISDSVLHTQAGNVAVRKSEISFARGKTDDELKITLKSGHVSLPSRNLSANNFLLTSTLLTSGGFEISDIGGNGVFETSRGDIRAEFGVSVPKDNPSSVWEGRFSFSEFPLFGKKGEVNLNSVAFGKDGVLSIRGDMSLGSLSSRIRATVNTAPGKSLIPELGGQNGFEIESDIFRRYYGGGKADDLLPLGGLKIVGNIAEKNGLLAVSGKLSEDYKLDLFEVGAGLEKSDFEIFFKNYKINSGNLLIKSSGFSMKAEGGALRNGGLEVKYKVQSKNVFHLSKITRILKSYGMSGEFKSSGALERRKNGKLFLSGQLELKDFSAALRKRIHIGKGEVNFRIPVEKFRFRDAFVKSSLKEISYGETLAPEINFGIDGDSYAELDFGDDRFLGLIADIRRKNGELYAEVKKAEFGVNDFNLSLSRNFIVKVSREKIDVENSVFSGKGAYLQFSGLYERGEKRRDLNLSASFSGLNTEFFEHFHPPLARYRGLVSGKIILDGPAEWPVANVDVKYLSASGEEEAVLSIVRPAFSDRFSVNLSVDKTTSGSFFKIKGGISSATEEKPEIKSVLQNISNYDLTLKAKDFSIKPLNFLSKKIQDVDGIFSGELSVFNREGNPDISGEIDIRGAQVRVDPWTELMEVDFLRTVFDKDKAFFSFRAIDPFGGMDGEGNFSLGDFSYSCEINLEGIFMHIKHLHSGFYGKIVIDGSGKNIRVRGSDLKTKGANILIKRDYNVAVGGLVFVDGGENGSFSAGKKPGFFSHTSDLDFPLHISGDTKFKIDKVNSLLAGTLHISRKPGDNFSAIKGDLSLIRGSYTILGKQFAIDKGSVSVSSRAHLSPVVNINAFYETPELSVKANLYGKSDDLTLHLSSAPAMEEDEIVLALLSNGGRGTNNRAFDVIKKVRDSGIARETVFGYAADELVSSVLDGNLFTFVDVFSVNREGGGGVFDSEIEVGAYLTDKLYFAYERINEILPISTSYKNRFTAEYNLNRHFVLEGVAGGLTPGANLLFNLDFR